MNTHFTVVKLLKFVLILILYEHQDTTNQAKWASMNYPSLKIRTFDSQNTVTWGSRAGSWTSICGFQLKLGAPWLARLCCLLFGLCFPGYHSSSTRYQWLNIWVKTYSVFSRETEQENLKKSGFPETESPWKKRAQHPNPWHQKFACKVKVLGVGVWRTKLKSVHLPHEMIWLPNRHTHQITMRDLREEF